MTGDPNANYNKRETKGFKLLIEFERTFNLKQIIHGHTTVSEGSKSLIDFFFTDIDHLNNSGTIETKMLVTTHQYLLL